MAKANPKCCQVQTEVDHSCQFYAMCSKEKRKYLALSQLRCYCSADSTGDLLEMARLSWSTGQTRGCTDGSVLQRYAWKSFTETVERLFQQSLKFSQNHINLNYIQFR